MYLDNESPTVSGCPASQNLSTAAAQDYQVFIWTTPTFIDNSGETPSVTESHASGVQISLTSGMPTTQEVVYEATDPSGNTEQCTFTLRVSDTESPTFVNCPSNIIQDTDGSLNYATVTWIEPTFSDNSGLTPSVVPTHTPPIQVSLSNGLQTTTTVSYVGTDVAGNSVEYAENPVYDACPSSMTLNTDAGESFATVTWTIPSFTDNSDETVNVTASHTPSIQVELDSGLTDTVTVTYDAVDPADTENPVITGCPSNANFDTDAGQAYATTTWTEPTYSDNSGLSTAVSSQSPGYQLSVSAGLEASESITYTLTDPSGNFDACTFTITVTDNESPTVSGCPASQNLSTAAAQDYQVFIWTTPTFIDNSGETPSVTESHASGVQVSLTSGMPTTQEVVYEATDPSGNTEQCTFTLRVS
ncbi:hyalin-like, partial [Anneissia japonica]|uniref:hyalin-like n=1 Tax=Anneissia japonica TaxID=1529436 RepID=UPI001425650E